jgi:hypothetical protein
MFPCSINKKQMKKTITKKLIALISAIIMCTNVFAQEDTAIIRKQQCDYLINNAPYIFEGKLISSKDLEGAYISNIIEVQNVIKGSIQKGTVEIITTKSRFTDDKGNQIIVSDNYPAMFSSTAIYFCADIENAKKLEYQLSFYSKQAQSANTKTLISLDGAAFTDNKIITHRPYTAFKYFTTMSQFYSYISKNYAIKIDKSLLEKKSLNTTTLKQTNSDLSTQRLKNVESYNKYLKSKSPVKKTSNASGCGNLFLSEFLDGQSSNNAVEVYNPTASPINLSNYKLLIYHNASLTPTTIALTGTIAPYGTHVVAQQGASAAILSHANQTTNNLNFNGNVVTALNIGNTHIDIIGEIGVANSAGNWTLTPSGGTNNSDIRRKYNISAGDTNWTNSKATWDVFPDDSISNFGNHLNICGVDPDLNINFANPYSVDSTNGKSYFEFNITASSVGANTYLDNAPVRIQYNTSAFGTYIATNNKVTALVVSPFDTLTYINPNLHISDVSADTINIGFGAKYTASSWSRVLITSTPIKLMRVFIEVQNCNQSSALSFVDRTFTGDFLTWYVAGQHDNPNTATDISYTNVNYGADLNYTIPTSACGMTITDFPSPVIAGIGQTIVILGNGFGNTQGSGQVKFKNADDGGATSLNGLNTDDYVVSSWSDNQIKIILPSFIDGSVATPNAFIIGGGTFTVTNNAGQSDTSRLNSSGNPFKVDFSLGENRNTLTNNKDRINLRSTDTSGGYILRLNHNDFPAGSAQRIAYTKAVHDWRCMTEANISIGADTVIASYNPLSPASGINYVFFAPTTAFVAKTFRSPNNCITDKASLTKVDMQFSSTYTFKSDTDETNNIPSGQYDFYAIALHELGHFIGLEHNVITNELMYFQGFKGETAANRKKLISGTSPVNGGTYSVNHSITALSTGSICWPAMILGGCALPQSGIEQYQIGNYHLYPNPTTSTINIQGTSSLGAITVYNTIGQLIMQQTTKEKNAEIDLSQQAAGFYLIKIGNSFTKVIKQ